MTNSQLAYVIGLLALTDDPRQLAALGRFLADAFPDDAATPVLLRNVRRRVDHARPARASDSDAPRVLAYPS